MKNTIRCALAAVLLASGALAFAQQKGDAPPDANTAAIASANAHATDAGFDILARGGNAVDAAIAVATTLSVVQPEASGIGGGFLALIHDAATGKDVFIDAREMAPQGVRSADYLNADGTPNRDTSLNGPLAAGIPGEPAGLAHLAAKYGKLPLSVSVQPAIRLAEKGFHPTHALAGSIAERIEILRRYPASAGKFLPHGNAPRPEDILYDGDQARTLKIFAEKGAEGFYRGAVAQEMVAAVRASGGTWTLADLAGYRVRERAPIEVDYAGYRIFTAPPPSAGGVVVAEILNMLAGVDLKSFDQAHRIHYLVEAMRRAFRDHDEYLGDPDFVHMPMDMLLSPYYADGLRQSILPEQASKSAWFPATGPVAEPGMHTTHFSIIDKDGNMVAMTCTVNYTLGSGFVAGKSGVLLNDEMDDFALVPGKPNAYGLIGGSANTAVGGKRMLSAMTPSFVVGKDRLAVIGSPGGSTIMTQVLEGILAFIDGKSAGEITAQKRFHHQYLPDRIDIESDSLPEETTEKLKAMGYELHTRKSWGNMNVVIWDKAANVKTAASDPRNPDGLGKVR